VVEGARLESDSGDAHEVTLKHPRSAFGSTIYGFKFLDVTP
jgi:hypothetical protein